MAKTRQEIRNFLDSKVGHTCIDKSDAGLNGQCVCLIKSLMEFIGVGSPYAARGNAKDAGDTYIRQGIGVSGKGWLTIVVNRSMGGGYGHIWIDLINETNYESNGARALVTTKGTRPISQGQQFINFDKWVLPDPVTPPQSNQGSNKDMTPAFIRRVYYMVNNQEPSQTEVDFHMAKSNPESFINGFGDSPLWLTLSRERDALAAERNRVIAERDEARTALESAGKALVASQSTISDLRDILSRKEGDIITLNAQIESKDTEIAKLKETPIVTPTVPSENPLIALIRKIIESFKGNK